MFEKKSVVASAILAGLVSGFALAEEAAAPAAVDEGAKIEKKNECKGHKNECKGMKHSKKHGKKKGEKKAEKHACGGPNGCGGKEMGTKAEGDAKVADPAAPSTEKKAE